MCFHEQTHPPSMDTLAAIHCGRCGSEDLRVTLSRLRRAIETLLGRTVPANDPVLAFECRECGYVQIVPLPDPYAASGGVPAASEVIPC